MSKVATKRQSNVTVFASICSYWSPGQVKSRDRWNYVRPWRVSNTIYPLSVASTRFEVISFKEPSSLPNVKVLAEESHKDGTALPAILEEVGVALYRHGRRPQKMSVSAVTDLETLKEQVQRLQFTGELMHEGESPVCKCWQLACFTWPLVLCSSRAGLDYCFVVYRGENPL